MKKIVLGDRISCSTQKGLSCSLKGMKLTVQDQYSSLHLKRAVIIIEVPRKYIRVELANLIAKLTMYGFEVDSIFSNRRWFKKNTYLIFSGDQMNSEPACNMLESDSIEFTISTTGLGEM